MHFVLEKISFDIMSAEQLEAYGVTINDSKSVVISIASRGQFPAFIHKTSMNNIEDILQLYFNDNMDENEYSGGITDEEAKLIATFITSNLKNKKRIIFACEEGRSRSSGMALATLKYLGEDTSVITENTKFTPNRLVVNKVYKALTELES